MLNDHCICHQESFKCCQERPLIWPIIYTREVNALKAGALKSYIMSKQKAPLRFVLQPSVGMTLRGP
jgi:hypothetical protein